MRLTLCALSTVLLSGCSWMGFGEGSGQNGQTQNQSMRYHNAGQYGHQGVNYGQSAQMQSRLGPCEISSPTQPIPRGCAPEQVTIATARGGQPQQHNVNYTTGGYGSHAGQAYGHQGQAVQPKLNVRKRPKLRGALSLGYEPFAAGRLLEGRDLSPSPLAPYQEQFVEGTPVDGQVITNTYTGEVNQIDSPDISFGDVWKPTKVGLSGEYIFSDRTTAFADAGYAYSDGKKAGGTNLAGDIVNTRSIQAYNQVTGATVGTPVVSSLFVPNQGIARYQYDFSDYKSYDLNAGVRHYFNPINGNVFKKPVTPFVAASGGVSHIGEASYQVTEERRFLAEAFNDPEAERYYDVPAAAATRTQLFDSQWQPQGALLVGAEMQISPRTAIALETGVRYRSGLELSSGEKTDDTISVPVTLRTSFNF